MDNLKNSNRPLSENDRPDRSAQTARTKNASVISPEIVDALRKGDHTAYNRIFLHYRNPMFRFFYKLTGSQYSAEEILQEFFLNVWEKREQINPKSNIQGYFFIIAKNCAFRYMRHHKPDYTFSDVGDPDAGESFQADNAVILSDTEALIEMAVFNMPPLRREIFELSRKQGLSNEQIATKINTSKENVANHLTRARKDIKDILYLITVLFLVD